MAKKIVQLIDKDGNDIYPVSAGNGQVKIGHTIDDPTSLEYIDTDNIVDGAVTSEKIDFTTSTMTLEFTHDGYSVGTRTATVYRLSNSGLALVSYNGDVGYSTSTTGWKELSTIFPNNFQIITGSQEAFFGGDLSAYPGYNYLGGSAGQIYVYHDSAANHDFQIRLFVLGIIS